MNFPGHPKGPDRQNLTLWCELGWHPHSGYRFNTNGIISKPLLHSRRTETALSTALCRGWAKPRELVLRQCNVLAHFRQTL